MDVVPIPQLSDNYAYLLIDPSSGSAGVVDCAEAPAVLEEVARRRVQLRAVLATHHHFDHVGGNLDLQRAFPDIRIFGSAGDAPRIPGITDQLQDGAPVRIGTLTGSVLFIPAHTSGHIAYYFPTERVVFTGDTLFAGGCGRLFEGDAAQMMASLERLSSLPSDTRIFCGHEYTEKNLRFATTLEPGNPRLRDKLTRVEALRRAGYPTVPSTIADEHETNPFLRTDSAELQLAVKSLMPGVPLRDRVAVFAAVRALKDHY